MQIKLTKRIIDTAKPGETLWDSDLKGFGLRVTKAGVKSYVLKYRRGAVQRWVTIGRHGSPWAPNTARNEAKRLIGKIGEGKDPAGERKKDRDAETFQAFATRYLSDYAALHKKPATHKGDARQLERCILPVLGKLKVQDIQRTDIAKLHRDMKETPYLANRCLALLSHMFKKAEAWGERPSNSNPATNIEKYKETARKRYLSMDEISKLGEVLRQDELRERNPYVIAAIRLLMFTGARHGEILTLKWEHVDFENRILNLPDSKTGEKTIVLPAPALEILSTLPRQTGNPHVICGAVEGAHLVNLQKPWRRIRKAAGLDDVRIHDLRHSFASIAVSGGMSLPLIGSLLGHTQTQTTQRYAHLSDNPRKAAVEKVASEITAHLNGDYAELTQLKK